MHAKTNHGNWNWSRVPWLGIAALLAGCQVQFSHEIPATSPAPSTKHARGPQCVPPGMQLGYGYHATCWRDWPAEWCGCPPAMPVEIISGPTPVEIMPQGMTLDAEMRTSPLPARPDESSVLPPHGIQATRPLEQEFDDDSLPESSMLSEPGQAPREPAATLRSDALLDQPRIEIPSNWPDFDPAEAETPNRAKPPAKETTGTEPHPTGEKQDPEPSPTVTHTPPKRIPQLVTLEPGASGPTRAGAPPPAQSPRYADPVQPFPIPWPSPVVRHEPPPPAPKTQTLGTPPPAATSANRTAAPGNRLAQTKHKPSPGLLNVLFDRVAKRGRKVAATQDRVSSAKQQKVVAATPSTLSFPIGHPLYTTGAVPGAQSPSRAWDVAPNYISQKSVPPAGPNVPADQLRWGPLPLDAVEKQIVRPGSATETVTPGGPVILSETRVQAPGEPVAAPLAGPELNNTSAADIHPEPQGPPVNSAASDPAAPIELQPEVQGAAATLVSPLGPRTASRAFHEMDPSSVHAPSVATALFQRPMKQPHQHVASPTEKLPLFLQQQLRTGRLPDHRGRSKR